MHKILEIAFGVALGMVIFLAILWVLGTAVYICCGNSKKIATVRKMKVYNGVKIVTPVDEKESKPEPSPLHSEIPSEPIVVTEGEVSKQ